jgi:DNA polymerase-3 subunit gamma/tau
MSSAVRETMLPEPADLRGMPSYVSPAADSVAAREPQPKTEAQPVSTISVTPEAQIGGLQAAVLQALTEGNQRILVSMLSAGEWNVQGNEVVVKIAESQTVVDMSLSSDARRLAIAAASGFLGRAVKLRVVPGAATAPQENKRNGSASPAVGPGGRGRAEQDPVVRRMQEKFGAQVRTVIDYKEKR